MMRVAVARQVTSSSHFNTLNTRAAELRFQKAPGEVHASQRITGLDFRVIAQGDVIHQGSDANGVIRMRLRGPSSELQLLFRGRVVATYEVSMDLDELDDTLLRHGLEQRLRILGYHLGHTGPAGDGVVEIPQAPQPNTQPKPRANELQFELAVCDYQVDQSDAGQNILPDGKPDGVADRIGDEAVS
jgi:hypothetical protein